MAISWSELRDQIASVVLNDPGFDRVSREALKVYARWACREISYHTARASKFVYMPDGVAREFALPSDRIDDVEKVCRIAYVDGTTTRFLRPVRLEPGYEWLAQEDTTNPARIVYGYMEFPTGVLTLSFTPAKDQALTLYYFSAWKAPEHDTSLLEFPEVFEQPFSYLVAGYAMDPSGFQFSEIRTWNRKQDSGSPEDNTAHRQAEWYLKQAHRLLAKITPQDRETFYRGRTRTAEDL